MNQLLPALAFGFLAAGGLLPPQVDFRRLEARMRDKPAEAIHIAREAVEGLPQGSGEFRKVFAKAAEILSEQVDTMKLAEFTDLVNLYTTTLGDQKGARRVREQWLEAQERLLEPNNTARRLELARYWLDWLQDHRSAARLCQAALAIRPDLPAAEKMLRDELGYRLVGNRWVAPDPKEPSARLPKVRIGMPMSEVREAYGPPSRIARQVLYRRFLEQWTYDRPNPVIIEFDCLKGQEPRVLTLHAHPDKP
jgi:hypothetical protein